LSCTNGGGYWPQPDGLRAFTRFVGNSPLLAFHAPFDQAMIGRFVLAHLGSARAGATLKNSRRSSAGLRGLEAKACAGGG
jgi:hypothetical protein